MGLPDTPTTTIDDPPDGLCHSLFKANWPLAIQMRNDHHTRAATWVGASGRAQCSTAQSVKLGSALPGHPQHIGILQGVGIRLQPLAHASKPALYIDLNHAHTKGTTLIHLIETSASRLADRCIALGSSSDRHIYWTYRKNL